MSNPKYMVLGEGHPRVRHNGFRAAEREAHRLARKYPGKEFMLIEIRKVVTESALEAEPAQPVSQDSAPVPEPISPVKPKAKQKRDGGTGPLSAFIG